MLAPAALTISGPRSLVERVATARIDLAVGDRRAEFQDAVNPRLLDGAGNLVVGLLATPEQIVVTVPVRRTSSTRQVGIQPALDDKGLDPNYEIRDIGVAPTSLTLTGPQEALDKMDAYLTTTPISVTGHYSDFVIEAPLLIPKGLAAINEQGETVQSVKVTLTIAPVTGYLVLDLDVTLLNQAANLQATIQPSRVSVLLIGPRLLLAEIAKYPQTVRVQVDLQELGAGTYSLPLIIQAPDGVQVQLFPKEVQVLIK